MRSLSRDSESLASLWTNRDVSTFFAAPIDQTASHCPEPSLPVPPLHPWFARALRIDGNTDVHKLPPRIRSVAWREIFTPCSSLGLEDRSYLLVGRISLALGWHHGFNTPTDLHRTDEFTSRHSDDGGINSRKRLVVSHFAALVRSCSARSDCWPRDNASCLFAMLGF